MELDALTEADLFNFQGAPVRLEFVRDAKRDDLCGNVYAVDPDSRNLILAQFPAQVEGQEGECRRGEVSLSAARPDRLTFVSASSVKLLHSLRDEQVPQSSGAAPASAGLVGQLDALFGPGRFGVPPEEPAEVVSGRKAALLAHLRAKNIPFEEEQQDVLIGPVRVRPPYRAQDFTSVNYVALARTRKQLADVLQ